MLTYFIIGSVFSLVMNILWDINNKYVEDWETPQWTTSQSILLILFWPVHLTYFIYSFFNSLFSPNK